VAEACVDVAVGGFGMLLHPRVKVNNADADKQRRRCGA
jgi:hypothetical protein